MSSGPDELIGTSNIRSVRLIHLADALYQIVKMSPHARLADEPPLEQQRYRIAAERAWRHVESDLLFGVRHAS